MFWWCKSDVRSNLVSVSISRELPRNGTIKIENVAHPLEVNLRFYDDVEPLIVRGEVVQPNPDSTLLKLDLSVRIHRLDPEPHSLTVIKFLFPETTHNLRVSFIHAQSRGVLDICPPQKRDILKSYSLLLERFTVGISTMVARVMFVKSLSQTCRQTRS